MKNKYELVPYFPYNVTGMKLHLEKMAQKGWIIDKITNNTWRYKKAEPQTLNFAVSYFAKASEFEPYKSEGQEMFEDLCEHAGWKLLAENNKLQIYANKDMDATPIYTDAESEVNAIIKSNKNFVWATSILMAVCVLNGFMKARSNIHNPLIALSDMTMIYISIAMIILFCHMTWVLLKYFQWKRKALAAVEYNEFIPTATNDSSYQHAILILVITIMIFGVVSSKDYQTAKYMLIMGLGTFCIYLIVDLSKRFMKKRKVEKDSNIILSLLLNVVLCILLVASVTYITFTSIGDTSNSSEKVYFTTADFKENESKEMYTIYKESPWISYNEAFTDGGANEYVYYRVIDVKKDKLNNFALESLLKDIEEEAYYEEIDAREFDADKAYQLINGSLETYLLKYGSRYAEVQFSWKLTTQDKFQVADLLK